MDGDSIIMNPNSKGIKIMDEQPQLIQPNPAPEDSRENRCTLFHRRARLRSDVEIESSCAAADSSAVGDVLTPPKGSRMKRFLCSFLGTFSYFLFQIGFAIVETFFSAASNPRLWSVAWIAVSAAAEIFIYLVLALATVFVAIIINLYEGPPKKEETQENDVRPSRTPVLPKESTIASLSSDHSTTFLEAQKNEQY